MLLQEEGGAKPTVVVGAVEDPKRDGGYWVSSGELWGDRLVGCEFFRNRLAALTTCAVGRSTRKESIPRVPIVS